MSIESGKTLSSIQFGENNEYIYLSELASKDFPDIISLLDQEALERDSSRVLVKIPILFLPEFLRNGYSLEAIVPNCFRDEAFAYLAKGTSCDAEELNGEQLVGFQNLLLHPRPKTLYTQGTNNIKEVNEQKLLEVAFVIQKGSFFVADPIWTAQKILQVTKEKLVIFGDYYGKELGAFWAVRPDFQNKVVEIVGIGQNRKHLNGQLLRSLFLQQSKYWRKQGIRSLMALIHIDQLELTQTFVQNEFQLGGMVSLPGNPKNIYRSLAVWYKSI